MITPPPTPTKLPNSPAIPPTGTPSHRNLCVNAFVPGSGSPGGGVVLRGAPFAKGLRRKGAEFQALRDMLEGGRAALERESAVRGSVRDSRNMGKWMIAKASQPWEPFSKSGRRVNISTCFFQGRRRE